MVNGSNWYLESVVTHHVTSNGNSLTRKSKYPHSGKLVIVDASQLSIPHISDLTFPASKPLKHRNILLVPSITKNLVSISKFTLDNHVIVEFDSDCCLVKDKQSKVVLLQGTLRNGLYHLHLPSACSGSLSSPCNNNLCSSNLQVSSPMNLASSYTVRENAFEDDNSYIAILNQHTIHKNVSVATGNSYHICDKSKATTSVGNSQSFMNVWHDRLGNPNKIKSFMQILNFAKLVNMVNSTRMCFLQLILYILQNPFK